MLLNFHVNFPLIVLLKPSLQQDLEYQQDYDSGDYDDNENSKLEYSQEKTEVNGKWAYSSIGFLQ